ncbi:pimelyl-ACP methyl ester esterase BioV [Caminibacter profundus]
MKYFSGFCLCEERELFKYYLENKDFVVAGFSKGAQDAVKYVLNTTYRINKLQLISPAFFDYDEKIINLNIAAFKKDKNSYIKNFLTKAGVSEWRIENGKLRMENKEFKICDCSVEDLEKLLRFDWREIEKIKSIKIEVFLGENDKIINVKKAYEFFTKFADVYFIKKANHFLRS